MRRRWGTTLLTAVAIAFFTVSCTAEKIAPSTRSGPTEPAQKLEIGSSLKLPLMPWEGGAEYWAQFPKTDEAGWDNPGFFPITLWYNGLSTDEEAIYDKSLGFNSYIGMSDTTPYKLFEDNDVYWIGPPLNETFSKDSKNWVGNFLGDEVDGRFNPLEGHEELRKAKKGLLGSGRFDYANFTQIVMGKDMKVEDSEKYVNAYTNVASIDMYWYTVPFCDWQPSPVEYVTPVDSTNCRTSSSYGKTMDSLRARDLEDGALQRMWQFVEILNGGPGQDQAFVANITPGELQGAVMNSIIHEARGLVYFNQSLNGDCTGGSLVRQTMVDPNFCAKDQVAAAGQINNRIHELAPVINTQTHIHDFGPGLDTMLKVKDGFAYVFAMIDDNPEAGTRTFEMPQQLIGRPIEVLFENRSISQDSSGRFKDNFEAEYSYHVYKVEL